MMNFFTKTLLSIFFIVFTLTTSATDYYVSNSGNDNNPGTSEGAPFLSINKLNTLVFQPGDRIFFQRGGEFRGELRLIYSGSAGNPILFDAYGTGALPVISGSEYINGWANAGNGIFVANCPFNPVMVFQNREAQTLGRYPNRGFLTIDVPNAEFGFTDNGLVQGNGYYTGSQVHVRSARWRYEEKTVQAYNDRSVTFNSPMSFPLRAGWGYFFSNKQEFVDSVTEYFYSDAAQQLFLKTRNGQVPADFTVEGSRFSNGFNLEGASNVTIRNLQFSHQKSRGIYSLSVGNNITISNCVFNNIFNSAIGIVTKDNVTISNNQIFDMWGYGISFFKCNNAVLENNVIKRIGVGRPGIATSDGLPYIGVQFDRSSGFIRDNVIDSIGYTGIRYGKYTTIERNLVSNFCMTTDDGAGIYTWGPVGEPDDQVPNGTGCFIRNNIVRNARTNTESTADYPTFVAGIFMDDFSGNATIENNTVINSDRIGLFIHNSSGNIMRNNTAFDCKDAPFGIWHDQVGPYPANNTISDNIFYNIYDNKQSAIIANYNAFNFSGLNFGVFSGNYYCNPYNAAPIFTSVFLSNGSQVSQNISVAEWKQTKDATAKESFVKFDNYTITSTNSGNLVNNGNFDANLNNWYCYGCDENSWQNNGVLDGGYVRLNTPSTSFYGSFYNTTYFTIEQAKQYLLSYSVVGPQQGAHTLSFADGVNFSTVTDTKIKTFNTDRADQKVLLTANANTGNARANFSIGPPNDASAFSLDNVSVYQVTTVPANPYDKNFIFTNESNQPKTVPLTGVLYDINGAAVSGSITIPAWGSKILVSVQGGPPPPPTPNVSIGDTTVYENSGAVSLSVCLSAPSAVPITVQYESAGGSATAGLDYAGGTGTITIPAGQTCVPLNLQMLTDNLDEPTEFVLFRIFNAQNATIADQYGVLNIINSASANLPTMSLGDVVVTETSGTARLNVCLSTPSNQTVTVQYESVGGSATAGLDYTGPTGTVTIPAGQTCVPINIPILTDNIDEQTEIVLFRIFNAQNATIVDEYGVLNIINVAGGGNNPTMTLGDVVVTETVGTARLNVCLSAASNQAVTVQYESVGGSATPGLDYTGTTGTITIPAGQTCVPINIPILTDNIDEQTEIVLFRIFNAQNATIVDEYGVLNIINVNPPFVANIFGASIPAPGATAQMTIKSAQVLPNPFTKSVQVVITTLKEEKAEIALLDIFGKQIALKTVQLRSGKNQVQFNELDRLKSGNYFIRIVSANQVQTLKVVKLRQ